MKSRYLVGILILLIAINFALLYKNSILKKRIKEDIDILKNPSIKIKSIPDFVLYDLSGERYSSQRIVNNSPHTFLVFFSPADCASCLLEKELWKKISEKMIKIIGIARHIDLRELKDWVENSEINFPVLYDIDSEVTRKFGIDKTPLKLLLDDRGKILLVDNVRIILSEQEEFIEELDKILGR